MRIYKNFTRLEIGEKEKAEEIIRRFLDLRDNPPPEPKQLIGQLKDTFPIQRGDFDSWRCQVAALKLAADYLFERVVKTGVPRQAVAIEAGLRSLNQFHYLTGSREPQRLCRDRDDAETDLNTSEAKFTSDIKQLVGLLRKKVMVI